MKNQVELFLSVLLLCGAVSAFHRFNRHPEGRVVGSYEADPHQYPFMVSLFLLDAGHNCGGVILSDRWILTAGHCIYDRETDEYVIAAGKHDISTYEEGEQAVYAEKFIVHENFSAYEVGPNDIGLIYLKDPLVFDSSSVSAVELPEQGSIPSGAAKIVGWGSTSYTLDAVFPDTLQVGDVELLDYTVCKEHLAEVNFDERSLCSGPLDEKIGHCDGDSGSGLIQDINGKPTVVGIASFAYRPCGTKNIPPALARVSYYVDWINNQIKETTKE